MSVCICSSGYAPTTRSAVALCSFRGEGFTALAREAGWNSQIPEDALLEREELVGAVRGLSHPHDHGTVDGPAQRPQIPGGVHRLAGTSADAARVSSATTGSGV